MNRGAGRPARCRQGRPGGADPCDSRLAKEPLMVVLATTDDRAKGLQVRGFTASQARFLTLVLRRRSLRATTVRELRGDGAGREGQRYEHPCFHRVATGIGRHSMCRTCAEAPERDPRQRLEAVLSAWRCMAPPLSASHEASPREELHRAEKLSGQEHAQRHHEARPCVRPGAKPDEGREQDAGHAADRG